LESGTDTATTTTSSEPLSASNDNDPVREEDVAPEVVPENAVEALPEAANDNREPASLSSTGTE